MTEDILPTTDEAVKKATGKTWEQWMDFLDKEGAKHMEHKDIVQLLQTRKLLSNQWWCQTVTLGYERVRKGRDRGNTADAGYQIGVTKTIAVSPREVWRFITTVQGLSLWLGKGARISFKPRRAYATADGTTGEVRTVKNGEKVRLTWKPSGREAPTTLQVTVIPKQNNGASARNSRAHGTSLAFHQEKLANAKERERMQRHWQKTLERIARELEKKEVRKTAK